MFGITIIRSGARKGYMAPKPELGRLAFVFGMVLAVALTILVIMTWMDPDLAAPNPPTQPIPIYQPQHLNVY